VPAVPLTEAGGVPRAALFPRIKQATESVPASIAQAWPKPAAIAEAVNPVVPNVQEELAPQQTTAPMPASIAQL